MGKDKDLLLAMKAAFFASEEILAIYEKGQDGWQIELKKDASPLTLADQAAHEAIVSVLAESDYPVLSEEGQDIPYIERTSWKVFWLVDPLDGTKEFIKRNGEFTVNIALIEDQKPILGVVWVPVLNKVYFSSTESGSYCLENACTGYQKCSNLNELMNISKKIKAEQPESGKTIRVVTSRSHSNEETASFIKNLKEEYSKVEVVSAGSSLKFCLVAEGKAHIYPRFGPTMEWDTAAGQAIVEGAEGHVVNLDSEKPFYYNKKELQNLNFIVKMF